MAYHHHRLQAFVKLGNFLQEYCEYANGNTLKVDNNTSRFAELDELINKSGHKNGWFTRENVIHALEQWGELLTEEELSGWLANYDLSEIKPKTVAIIMAGNIPLVGFHDFLCAFILGHDVILKLSSNDPYLLPYIAKCLDEYEPGVAASISFQENRLDNFDVIIATGSDNTARYFEYYFRDKPSIIRKNRVSVGVLTGEETPEMLTALGEDIFRYFGLGCRSVSKLYIPKAYSFDTFFEAIYPYKAILELNKYANNYDYNKAVYLMSEFKILDNGFLMLKQDENFGSPIATLFFEEYETIAQLKEKLEINKQAIQCVVSQGLLPDEIPFGNTQSPGLDDYADAIDTVEFLLKTSHN